MCNIVLRVVGFVIIVSMPDTCARYAFFNVNNFFKWTDLCWSQYNYCMSLWPTTTTSTTTTIGLRPFVQDYLGELVPEETFTHSRLLWSSIILYLLPHLLKSIASSLFNLHASQPLSSVQVSRSGTFHFILHTFLHPFTVFFSVLL